VLPTAIILLAAGCSSRLGRPKQLLPYRGSTLLRHAAKTAIDAELGPVFVILGAVVEECRATLLGLPATIVVNPAWDEGMGGSIACGAQQLDESVHGAAIILLCDQPGITPAILRALDRERCTSGAPIVASRCGDVLGPPAFFAAPLFTRLRALRGADGARALFRDEPNVATVDCSQAAWDIDTEADAMVLDEARRCDLRRV
jgi:molybdenum cofactor cytidylyltransferase